MLTRLKHSRHFEQITRYPMSLVLRKDGAPDPACQAELLINRAIGPTLSEYIQRDTTTMLLNAKNKLFEHKARTCSSSTVNILRSPLKSPKNLELPAAYDLHHRDYLYACALRRKQNLVLREIRVNGTHGSYRDVFHGPVKSAKAFLFRNTHSNEPK